LDTFLRFQKPFAVVFKKISCSAVLAVDPYCTIKAVSRTKTLVSAGCTFKVPLQKLYVRRCRNFGFTSIVDQKIQFQLHVKSFYKSFNVYRPTVLDNKVEVCEFSEGYLKGNQGHVITFFKNLLPSMLDIMTPLIQHCPYMVHDDDSVFKIFLLVRPN
jgi:hypothetical protein